MAGAITNDKDIKELQRLAQTAPQAAATRASAGRRPLSRAARLEAIDLLSRWSAGGLALIAGGGVYLAMTAGRAYPIRAAAWAAMLLAALWVCRRMRSTFRAGASNAGKPFRWRASYAACLSVLGVAFASAPILLAPSIAPAAIAVQTTVLTLACAYGAAIFFSAHAQSAAGIMLPSAAFCLMAAIRNGEIASGIYVAVASLMAIAGLIFLHTRINDQLARRHPRTTSLRTPLAQPPSIDASAQDQTARQTA